MRFQFEGAGAPQTRTFRDYVRHGRYTWSMKWGPDALLHVTCAYARSSQQAAMTAEGIPYNQQHESMAAEGDMLLVAAGSCKSRLPKHV